MARQRTGTVERHRDHWDAKITLDDGSRPRICLPPELDEQQARARARRLAVVAAEEGATMARAQRVDGETRGDEGEPLKDYADRWCAAREKRGLSSVDDDRGRLRKWIFPLLGERTPITAIQTRDLERLVEFLDEQVIAEELSWKTAKNTWAIVSAMFKDAERSKVLALRVRKDNPAFGVRGPDEGVKKSTCYLFPSEFMTLASCERVPLRWRRLFSVAIYTYARAAELEALECEDIDLEHRLIHIHRAIDRSEDGKVKETKTNNPRKIPIEPAIFPLLVILKREAKGRRLLDMPPERDLSDRLRQYLAWAGITRAELFANDATRKQLRFHDLRATGITWMAIRGDDPVKMMRRAGHTNLKTTNGYIREAENLEHPVGEPFAPLPACLLDPSGETSGETSGEPSTPAPGAGKPGGSAPVLSGIHSRWGEGARAPSLRLNSRRDPPG